MNNEYICIELYIHWQHMCVRAWVGVYSWRATNALIHHDISINIVTQCITVYAVPSYQSTYYMPTYVLCIAGSILHVSLRLLAYLTSNQHPLRVNTDVVCIVITKYWFVFDEATHVNNMNTWNEGVLCNQTPRRWVESVDMHLSYTPG